MAAATALYGLLAWARVRLLGVPVIVVVSKPRCQIAMQCYEAVFPLAVLVLSAAAHPTDWITVGVHLILFRDRPWWAIRDADAMVLVASRAADE